MKYKICIYDLMYNTLVIVTEFESYDSNRQRRTTQYQLANVDFEPEHLYSLLSTLAGEVASEEK